MHISRATRLALVLLPTALTACGPPDVAPPRTAFELSGVIEGFYGPPWPHQDRLAMVRFMGRVGLDAYVYAPKDDPYHLARWREPYPVERLAELTELATVARDAGVEFHYAISPGGSMVYSDSGDYRALLQKLETVIGLGVRHVALFLDDVPPTLAHEADRAVFEDLAHAHATVINRLYDNLNARGVWLSVTPTTYTDAWGDTTYARRLGERTHRAVPFFWTGTDVVSPTITRADGQRWNRLLWRDPLIWDNYPVNDFARWRLFLGPVRGRAADAPTSIAGILSNPMNEAHASMIPLATLAEYARDPAAYDPDSAQANVLATLFDEATIVALGPFLRTYGDYSMDRNVFEPLFIPGRPIPVGATQDHIDDLRESLETLGTLGATRPTVRQLVDEFTPFVEQTETRWQELLADDRYERDGDLLMYRSTLDTYSVVRSADTLTVDGLLDDWQTITWQPLFRNGEVLRRNPHISIRHSGPDLVIAVTVPGQPTAPRSSPRIGTGDHIAIIVQGDTLSVRQGLSEDDLLLLLPAPERDSTTLVEALSMPFRDFMSKYLADNRNMQFTEFHVSTFGQAPVGPMAQVTDGVRYAARTEDAHWQAEIAIPMNASLRLSLSVTRMESGSARTYSWSRRSYPANPATYVAVVRRP